MQAFYEEYGDRGFMPISLVLTDLDNWVGMHGFDAVGSHPNLDDSGWGVLGNFVDGSVGTPNLTLLAPGLKVVVRGQDGGRIDAATIEQHLPENY